MFTDEQRSTVSNVLEKKQQNQFYRSSPEEQIVIDAVLDAIVAPTQNQESLANPDTID